MADVKDLLSMEWNGRKVPQQWFTRAEVVEIVKKLKQQQGESNGTEMGTNQGSYGTQTGAH